MVEETVEEVMRAACAGWRGGAEAAWDTCTPLRRRRPPLRARRRLAAAWRTRGGRGSRRGAVRCRRARCAGRPQRRSRGGARRLCGARGGGGRRERRRRRRRWRGRAVLGMADAGTRAGAAGARGGGGRAEGAPPGVTLAASGHEGGAAFAVGLVDVVAWPRRGQQTVQTSERREPEGERRQAAEPRSGQSKGCGRAQGSGGGPPTQRSHGWALICPTTVPCGSAWG